jgi:CubicO group peptidase (beta-lactamase class C family)
MTRPTSAQEKMQSLLEALVRTGPERGLQLAAFQNGVLVVSAWAGTADAASGAAVKEDTLFPAFSVTKGIAATVIHILVERGRLAYDTPIAEVWPEFGAKGKKRITVRHALAHLSGIPGLPTGLGYSELCDWDKICAGIAGLRPISKPGAVMTYHAATFGWILGEVARRVSGLGFRQLLEREIEVPLGLSDLYVGIPDEVESRIAAAYDPVPGPDEPPPPDDSEPRDIPGWMYPLGAMISRPDVRRACMPAVNGIMNARSLARFYAGLLPEGIDGKKLLPPGRMREATRQHALQSMPEPNPPRRLGLGYFLGGAGCPEMSLRLEAFGHGGYGGALGYADPAYRLAVGFTKNFLSREPIRLTVMLALRQALGIPET